MSALAHLPSSAVQTAADQGWNEETLVVLLTGFISRQGLDAQLTDYLATVAAEENAHLGTNDDDVDPS
ncbi:hypothetical protein [Sphingomonas sp. 3-13AW]|uniref:hypothetical protein n=1 Tax=Sphingomonas sp. 3-13AW TaxID=3050450 RepID=UPI003BB6F8FC